MEQLVTFAAEALGTPPDLIKIVLCLVLNYPLCAIVKRINNRTVKCVYILALGVYYLVGIFSFYGDTALLFLQCFITYFLCYAPQSSKIPWINQVLQIAILMVTHCREQFSGGDFVNNIGISGSQMILVIKLTSYAWDVHDGTRSTDKLNTHQASCRIATRPSLLKYLAWCFFFPSVMTGPTCQYSDFDQWLTRDGITIVTKDKKTVTKKIPSSAKAAAFKTIEALFWTYLFFSSSSFVSFDYALKPAWRALPFYSRAFYLALVAITYQLKYYVAWSFSEAACILCGLGYNGPHPTKENRYKWDRLQNVRPLRILTAQNCHGYINNWNINTANWLRYYVYERVTPQGKKPGTISTLATFFFSAVWHGTRPGYYLTFILCAVYQRFGRLFRHKLRPLVVGTSFKPAYDLISWAVTQSAFGFAVQPFIVLDMEPSLHIWTGVYYWPVLGCIASYALLVWPLGSLYKALRKDIRKELNAVE